MYRLVCQDYSQRLGLILVYKRNHEPRTSNVSHTLTEKASLMVGRIQVEAKQGKFVVGNENKWYIKKVD